MSIKFIRRFVIVIFFFLVIGGAFGSGFIIGQDENKVNLKTPTPAGISNLISSTKPSNIDFSLFWESWNLVNREFIGQKDDEKRVEGAIAGMLTSLDDPYTVYLPPTSNEIFLSDLEGHFDGIGAELAIRDAQITVVAPLEDSPAEKAGIKAKDIILKIDGEEADKMTFDKAIMKIRGVKGTKVKLTVLHDNEIETVDLDVTRDTIVIESVKLSYPRDDKKIALIKLNQFHKDTTKRLKEIAKELETNKVEKVIVDVRNNPGGLLDQAISVSSLFLDDNLDQFKDEDLKKGVMVKEEEKNGEIKNFKRTEKQIFNQDLIIIQNKGSASASEIFAGAIKDYERGKVVGEKSFGKGSVQNLAQLSNKGSIKITIARWLTPKGLEINGTGIEPDIKIEDNEDDSKVIDQVIELFNQ